MYSFDNTRIVSAREVKGLNQAEAAALMGITSQQLSQWERGEVKPGMESFEKICNTLHAAPRYFFVKSANFANNEN